MCIKKKKKNKQKFHSLTESWTYKTHPTLVISMDSSMCFRGCHVCLILSFHITDSEALEAVFSSFILPKEIFFKYYFNFKKKFVHSWKL